MDSEEIERIEKYQELARDVNTIVTIILVVTGALGAKPKQLHNKPKDISTKNCIVELHKSAIFFAE